MLLQNFGQRSWFTQRNCSCISSWILSILARPWSFKSLLLPRLTWSFFLSCFQNLQSSLWLYAHFSLGHCLWKILIHVVKLVTSDFENSFHWIFVVSAWSFSLGWFQRDLTVSRKRICRFQFFGFESWKFLHRRFLIFRKGERSRILL